MPENPADLLRRAAAAARAVREHVDRTCTIPDDMADAWDRLADTPPALLTAIADWLELAAAHQDAGYLCCDHGPDRCSEIAAPALAVARAVLGKETDQ